MRRISALFCVFVLCLAIAGCGKNEIPDSSAMTSNTNSEATVEEAKPTEEAEPEKEYFTEYSSMPTPDSTVKDIKYKGKEDGYYNYSLGTDEHDAEIAVRAWMAVLMMEDFDVSDANGNGSTFKVKKNGSTVAVYGVGYVDGEYTMMMSFN